MSVEPENVEVVDGEIVPEFAIVPYTGEALDLPALNYTQLAEALDEAGRFEREALRGFKSIVREEVLNRMDEAAACGEDGAWTVRAEGGWKLEGDGPDKTGYDVNLLRTKLEVLRDAGKIKQEAIDKVIVPERWKVAKRPLSQLLKLGGEVAEAIRECEHPERRYVRVTQS